MLDQDSQKRSHDLSVYHLPEPYKQQSNLVHPYEDTLQYPPVVNPLNEMGLQS